MQAPYYLMAYLISYWRWTCNVLLFLFSGLQNQTLGKYLPKVLTIKLAESWFKSESKPALSTYAPKSQSLRQAPSELNRKGD